MLIAKILGGLGNQLFIYAMARSLQLELGEPRLYLDISEYKKYQKKYGDRMPFLLEHFALPESVEVINLKALGVCGKYGLIIKQKLYHVIQKLYRKLRDDCVIGEKPYHRWIKRGCYFNFDKFFYPPVKTEKDPKLIYGYFQSDRYFASHIDTIRQELKVTDTLTAYEKKMLDTIRSCNAVAVSIRTYKIPQRDPDHPTRIKNLAQGVLPRTYFKAAIKKICASVDSPHFFVFSNDLEKVKAQYALPEDVTYIENVNPCQGLQLMSACRHFIISNSTFSWWGAYLGTYPDKIVVSPGNWCENEPKRIDIYFDGMTFLDR